MFKRLSRLKNSKKEKSENNKLTASLQRNTDTLKHILANDDTVNFKFFHEPNSKYAKYCIVFVNTITSEKILNDKIIEPMQNLLDGSISGRYSIDYILNYVIACRDVQKSSDINFIVDSLLHGSTILLLDGVEQALLIGTQEWNNRAISEPETERVVRGPREGFTESLNINLSLIRRKISSPDLKFRFLELGTLSKTKVCICYLAGIASEKILEEVEKRLHDVKIDGIIDSGYIQELIKDSPLSPFKTIGNTERPDIVAAKLLEGRIALICEGSPSALTMPFIFLEYFQSNEDYYNNFVFSSINRLLRILSFFLTTSIPAIFLSLVSFHQELMPTSLILSLASSRQDIPFPTVIETILMGLFFELLREAGVRLPLAVGQAVSIVGALVLGEAAVSARLISAPMVIVTALTGISSFLIPKMNGPIIIIRLFFLMFAAVFGLYGFMVSVFALVTYLMSIRSFGIPYMMNTVLISINDIKDTSIRAPWWLMYYRPKFSVNSIRKAGVKTPKARQ